MPITQHYKFLSLSLSINVLIFYFFLQGTAVSNAKHVIRDGIQDVYCTNFPPCLAIADLGCSSGPNSLLLISEIVNILDDICHRLDHPLPELQVFLNDLPGNDFNTLFASLPKFYEKLKKEKGDHFKCYITATPGSFYGRLFPSNVLHFAHSSYTLHWLSQVPRGLEGVTGISLNKGNIYIGESTPPDVIDAYVNQFQMDFTVFLKSRSEELVPGGHMVLNIVGRRSCNQWKKEVFKLWELLSMALREMVSEGLVEEAKLDCFNLPYYTPSAQEIRDTIQMEGSFRIDSLETFEISWDPDDMEEDDGEDKDFVIDTFRSAQNVTKWMRAIAEPILMSHFREVTMDELFQRYTNKVAEHLGREKGKFVTVVVSLANIK
ncbi:PREDICTED: salicylate carboxymethyltransferase-like [Nelumbo nucifera]|uniref:Salicylate carboxymethyltransferase-like n=1 Tax=Nelumbo nucifera TaxID=4432 RepID=A0A1U7ZUD5_NELNU|nr:PREDICTED: salicylate carboxymethyltransferase-like [Nelumbo nucifera]